MQPIQIISKRNELAIATHRFELNMKKVDGSLAHWEEICIQSGKHARSFWYK